jgi:hypothetical protein
MFDTSLGWRFTNPKMAERFPLESMGETAENVAALKLALPRGAGPLRPRPATSAPPRRRRRGLRRGARPRRDPAAQGPRGRRRPRRVGARRRLLEAAREARSGVSQGRLRHRGQLVAHQRRRRRRARGERGVRAQHGLTPLARVVRQRRRGRRAGLMGLGPIPAMTRSARSRRHHAPTTLDTVELNEAFAAQALACIDELGLDPARVNPDGGAIALGHPIGCSGARIATTLLHRMRREGLKLGAASLCIGVGQGIATIFERAGAPTRRRAASTPPRSLDGTCQRPCGAACAARRARAGGRRRRGHARGPSAGGPRRDRGACRGASGGAPRPPSRAAPSQTAGTTR